MGAAPKAARLPPHLPWLVGIYAIASLVHFTHNAEYIALYPNLPAWLDREYVYLAWIAVTAVGAAGAAMWALGWRGAAIAGSRGCTPAYAYGKTVQSGGSSFGLYATSQRCPSGSRK